MSHTTIQWVLTAAYALSILCQIGMIGRPRDPYTPLGVIGNAVTAALICWAVWSL